MARNVEIKARIAPSQFSELRQQAEAIATSGPTLLEQTDTFFQSKIGRLKLREFGNGTAELIQYERPDCSGPKVSSYVRSPCPSPASMKAALDGANGIIGVVQKRREVFFVDNTRVHLDHVKGLGTYLELEVVLGTDDLESEGEAIANRLLVELGVDDSQLVSGAYFDLMSVAQS